MSDGWGDAEMPLLLWMTPAKMLCLGTWGRYDGPAQAEETSAGWRRDVLLLL